MNITWSVMDFLNRYANLLLVGVTITYVIVNAMLVRETRSHRLQQVIPYVRVVFEKVSGKVLLENIGPGIVTKAMLQGFVREDQGERRQFKFEPVYAILPRETVPVKLRIELPEYIGQPILTGREIFKMAFENAPVLGDALTLDVVQEDILRNCYKSQVRVHTQELFMFLNYGNEERWAIAPTPPVREKHKCPDTLPLVDTIRIKK